MVQQAQVMFQNVVTSEQELRDLMGEASELSLRKEHSYLTEQARAFIACSPFLVLATAGRDGTCDVSPKGDAPGFVRVLDDRHLVIPDRPGNKRFDGLQNIVETGRIGLLFMVPGRDDTVRVNGRAWITQDPELLDTMLVQGKRPWFAIGVEIEQAFSHCAKAFKRSRLWETESWPDPATVPTGAQLLMDAVRPADMTLQDMECRLEESYRTRMY